MAEMVTVAKGIRLDLPAGKIVLVNMTTQAGFTYRVVITDDAGTLFDETRRSSDRLPVISKTFVPRSGDLELEILCDSSSRLKTVRSEMSFDDDNGALLARNYVFMVEDETDNDYSDLFLTVGSWKD